MNRGAKYGRARSLVVAAAVLAAVFVGTASSARAQSPGAAPSGDGTSRAAPTTASAEALRSAAVEFESGRRAFALKNYDEAALHFENAFRDAPRAEALRSALRAREAAGDKARAATWSVLGLARYGSDEVTVRLAEETLRRWRSGLVDVVVHCEPACAVAMDDRVLSLDTAREVRVFVEPGRHAMVVSWAGRPSQQQVLVGNEGDAKVFHLVAPAPPARSSQAGSREFPVRRKPLDPAYFWVGASLTAVGGVATVISGIHAQGNPGVDAVRRGCVGQGESCELYQEGLRAERRTNGLLVGTLAVGAVTGVVGLVFTQWGTRPGSGAVSGAIGGASPWGVAGMGLAGGGGLVVTGTY